MQDTSKTLLEIREHVQCRLRGPFLRQEMGPCGDPHKSLNYIAFSGVSFTYNCCSVQGDSKG